MVRVGHFCAHRDLFEGARVGIGDFDRVVRSVGKVYAPAELSRCLLNLPHRAIYFYLDPSRLAAAAIDTKSSAMSTSRPYHLHHTVFTVAHAGRLSPLTLRHVAMAHCFVAAAAYGVGSSASWHEGPW